MPSPQARCRSGHGLLLPKMMNPNSPDIKIVCNADATDKATFIITGEDHTLGNALRYMLIRKCARLCSPARATRAPPGRPCLNRIRRAPPQSKRQLLRLLHPAPVGAENEHAAAEHRCVFCPAPGPLPATSLPALARSLV